MTDAMADTETLGREPGCAILSLGVKIFNPHGDISQATSEFYRTIDLTSQLLLGFHVNEETLEWWRGQEAKAQSALSVMTKPIVEVLKEFREWWNLQKAEKIWCQGATFDAPILAKAFEIVGMEVPWKFYNVRDTRTVYDMCGFDPYSVERTGTYHNALDDARHQVDLVQRALKQGIKKPAPFPLPVNPPFLPAANA